jgi:hypothetical protein
MKVNSRTRAEKRRRKGSTAWTPTSFEDRAAA